MMCGFQGLVLLIPSSVLWLCGTLDADSDWTMPEVICGLLDWFS